MSGIGAARRRLLQLNKNANARPRTSVSETGRVVEAEAEATVEVPQPMQESQPALSDRNKENLNFCANWSDESVEKEEPEHVPQLQTTTKGNLNIQLTTCNETINSDEIPTAKAFPQAVGKPTSESQDNQVNISDTQDVASADDDEWNRLSQVPFENRKRFLREMTTFPLEESTEAGPSNVEIKKQRIQMLLAEHKFGVPSLALADEYEKLFGQKFDVQDWGYEMLSDMIADMSDIITVQEPDEISCLYHPKYPNDRILLDKRYGHHFTSHLPISPTNATSTSGLGTISETDFDSLISRAKINHDCEFPNDVVLPGEQYTEPILIKTAQIDGTCGVFTCLITGVANPNHFYVNVKNEYTQSIETFTSQVKEYFKASEQQPEAYKVPEEFIYPGFACLRQRKDGPWERVSITGRSPTDNKILVESVDFGGTDAVELEDLRLMPRKFMSASRQAIVVSLFGLKPQGDKWSPFSGQKIAGWSYEYYWMECLFLEPKVQSTLSEVSSLGDAGSTISEIQQFTDTSSACSTTTTDTRRVSINRRIWYRKPQYELIILDRMIPSYHAFIDEILVAQMLAVYVPECICEMDRLKLKLKNVLKDISPHENPMEKSFKKSGYI